MNIIYDVTRQDIDGFGTNETEYVQFACETPLPIYLFAAFQSALKSARRRAVSAGNVQDTYELIETALQTFNQRSPIKGRLMKDNIADDIFTF